MLKAILNSNSNKPSASIANNALILSLPNALTPVVWQWDLGDVKASAIEIQEAEEGNWKLILKTPKGPIHDIAQFSNREETINVLNAVTTAMTKSTTAARASNDTKEAPAKTGGEGSKTLTAFLALIIIIGLVIWLGSLMPNELAPGQDNLGGDSYGESGTTSESNNGVPMSAEDFINRN